MQIKFYACLAITILRGSSAYAQGFAVAPGTTWHAADNTPVRLSISGDIDIETDALDFGKSIIELTGTSQTLTSANSVKTETLLLNGPVGATFSLAGSGIWEVSKTLTLGSGIVAPGSATLLYTGGVPVEGNIFSYVDGSFHQKGGTSMYFPIGNSGLGTSPYLPAVINRVANGDIIVGLSVVNASPGFTASADIATIEQNFHYEISGDLGNLGDHVTISLQPGSLKFEPGAQTRLPGAVILQGTAIGDGAPDNIGGQTYDTAYVTSLQRPSKPILGIAASKTIDIIIYDLITPFTKDGVNDRLRISNIEAFPSNTVTLLDRWGQVAKKWTNFTNADAEDFDFTRLTPDSYICILEYQDTGNSSPASKKIAQMVTLLKAK